VARLVGHENRAPISVVHFTPNGKYCLTGAHDRTVKLWNPSRLDPAFPPSKYQSYGDTEDIKVADLPRSLCIQTYHEGITHEVSALAVDSEGESLITACDKSLVLHNLVTGQCKRRYHGHHTGRINAVAMGPFAETYLTASYDATVKIWDARNHSSYEPIQTLKEAKDSVADVHVDLISPHLIRTASVDGVIRCYDVRMGIITCDDCHVAITSIAQSHDGQCLAVHGLDDATIRLLDLAASGSTPSSLVLNTFTGHHKAGHYALKSAFTADDTTLASGSENGNVVLYHVVTAEPVVTLEGHEQPTCAVATSPSPSDGVRLDERDAAVITASYDGNAIVWAHSQEYMRWQE